MYSLKISRLFLLCALTVCLLSGCKRGQSELPGTKGNKNLSVEAIETSIIALDTAEWEEGVYEEILNNQILGATEIVTQDRDALSKMLREKYASQLLRCIDDVMTASCAGSHEKLAKMMGDLDRLAPSLNNYRDAEIRAAKERYRLHNDMLRFDVAGVYSKSVTPYSVYDSSYDSERRSTAKKYRDTQPTCTEIISRISENRVNTRLRSRKENFETKREAARRKARENGTY